MSELLQDIIISKVETIMREHIEKYYIEKEPLKKQLSQIILKHWKYEIEDYNALMKEINELFEERVEGWNHKEITIVVL